MYFNKRFEKSPTESSFKWSILIMDKGECRRSARINFGNFIVFDLHSTTCQTVYSLIQNFLLKRLIYFLLYKISPQLLSVQTIILQKSLNGQYNGKWILILILPNKLKSYYLAKKQVPNHIHHWILMTILFTKFNSIFRSKIKFWWTYSMHLNHNPQNNWIDQKAVINHTEGSIVNNL